MKYTDTLAIQGDETGIDMEVEVEFDATYHADIKPDYGDAWQGGSPGEPAWVEITSMKWKHGPDWKNVADGLGQLIWDAIEKRANERIDDYKPERSE